ncbi:MAG TPA: hypothetical protein VNC40_12310 [Gaiellaceae bacterium]|nr:hypothetical protein [Gaiellaceae bacterium]
MDEPLVVPAGPNLAALVASFEELAAGARSVFPGRVLLSRKKATGLLEVMRERLLATEVSRVDTEPYIDALTAVSEFRVLTDSGGFMPWANVWRYFYLDISRKRLARMVEDLRDRLAPFMGTPIRSG